MIKIGCAGYPVRQSLYHQQLDFVEVGDRSGRKPREETLKRWRESAPEQFEFVIRAPQLWIDPIRASGVRWGSAKGPKKLSRAGSAESEIRRLRDELGAKVVLLELPNHFQASPDRVARFQTLVRSIPPKDMSIVWYPPKGWPASLIDQLSSTLKIFPAHDPLKAALSNKLHFRYFRLKAPAGTRFSDDQLKTVRRVCGTGLAYVVFDLGPNSFSEATRFSRLVKERA
jgi:uncharacterized protein YecE (DUF72 family)